MTYRPKRVGDDAENRALEFLQAQGLEKICRNYRCRWGEIDLIMRDNEGLVFVEVRYRRNQAFGSAADSVARHKQGRLLRSAQHYLCTVENDLESVCRFDIVALDTRHLLIDWIKDAFAIDD